MRFFLTEPLKKQNKQTNKKEWGRMVSEGEFEILLNFKGCARLSRCQNVLKHTANRGWTGLGRSYLDFYSTLRDLSFCCSLFLGKWQIHRILEDIWFLEMNDSVRGSHRAFPRAELRHGRMKTRWSLIKVSRRNCLEIAEMQAERNSASVTLFPSKINWLYRDN